MLRFHNLNFPNRSMLESIVLVKSMNGDFTASIKEILAANYKHITQH